MSDDNLNKPRIDRKTSQALPSGKTAATCLSFYGGPDGQRWVSQTLPIDFDKRERQYDAIVRQNRSLYRKVCTPLGIQPRGTCLDFRDSTSPVDHLGVDTADTNRIDWNDFNNILKKQPSDDTYLRLVVVEGLSDDVIRLLGSVFWLPLTVFTKHLEESPVTASAASSLPRYLRVTQSSFTSVSWFRPVWRSNRMLVDVEQRDEFVSNGTATSQTSKNVKGSQNRLVRTSIVDKLDMLSHIFRSEWRFDWWSSLMKNDQSETKKGSMAANWEERMTVYVTRHNGYEIVILLTDPLPIVRRKRTTSSRLKSGMTSSKETVDDGLLYQTRSTRSPGPVDIDTILLTKEPAVANAFDIPTYSMLESILEWSTRPIVHLHRPDPLYAILEMLQADLVLFMEDIETKLAEIEWESIIEHRLRDSLQDWRMFVKQCKTHLPRIHQQLQDFANTLYFDPAKDGGDTGIHASSRVSLPDYADRAIGSLLGQLQEMIQRCERTETSLRTEISLLDSRRSIAEAESVSKLTELAFIFIPLTFAASLFSIQVDQLQGGVPLSSFVITCVITLSVAYGARLSVRSNSLIKFKSWSLADARKLAGVEPMKKLSTAQFISWMLHTTFMLLKWTLQELTYLGFSIQVLVLFVVCSALIVPAILLWLSSTIEGLKGIMGFLYMAFALIFLVFSVRITMRWENRRLWWKRDVTSNVSAPEMWLSQQDAESGRETPEDDEDEGFWIVHSAQK